MINSVHSLQSMVHSLFSGSLSVLETWLQTAGWQLWTGNCGLATVDWRPWTFDWSAVPFHF